MSTKIILFITLLAYGIIVSQAFMYVLSLKNVQMNLSSTAYTEFRKFVDISMRTNFKYIIYIALFANLLLIISTVKNPGSLVFIMASISFVALVLDIILTLRENLPINDVINTWSADTIPADWKEFRAKWFNVFQYRQILNIIGFVCLSVAAVFGNKQASIF